MKTAIVFVDKNDQETLINQQILDKKLIRYTLDNLKKADFEKIIVVSPSEYNDSDIIWINNVNELKNEIESSNGKLIITGIHYPNLGSDVYNTLYQSEAQASILSINGETVEVFAIDNHAFEQFDSLSYEKVEVSKPDLLKVFKAEDVYEAFKSMQRTINLKHLNNGVNFLDIENTYIGQDVAIEKGVTLYPHIHLEGLTRIGANTSITSNSHIINSTIGENCQILASRITDSILHNKITLGPYSHLRMHCEVMDGVRIGNFVEFKKTHFGRISRCAHLTYLGDSEVGEDVNIGCGVITANYDGVHKFKTVIKDKSFIGSNSNLIAPVTIGSNVLVAAGSTITDDVEDGAMAIGRVRQEIKPDFGFKYINKERD